MSKFNVTVVTLPGSTVHHAFDEIHDSLCWALSALGHQVSKTENWFSETSETNLILGPELIADFTHIPDNSIIINLEQRSHPRLPAVRRLSKGLPVWDFTKGTSDEWPDSKQVIHLSVGFTPNLVRIPRHPKPDIDIFFVGFLTPRRREFLDSLKKPGLAIFAAGANCYGGVRDELLSRSKLALNIHHDGRDQFEIVRCSFLMANHIPIVSEPSSDDLDYEDLASGLTRLPIRVLPDFIHSLLAADGERERLASVAFASIERRNFTTAVAAALDSTTLTTPTTPSPRPVLEFRTDQRERQQGYLAEGRNLPKSKPASSQMVFQCYEAALSAGDMKDFLPWLRAHARGNIVEIGVRNGASTSAFLTGINDTYGHLWSIDINPACSDLFPGHPGWTFICSDSRDHGKLLPLLPDAIDLLLIDGDHSYEGVKLDFLYHQRVKEGGYVVFHDIAPEPWSGPGPAPADYPGDGVMRFWDEIVEDSAREGWTSFIIPGRYGMGVLRRAPVVEAIESDESWEGSKAVLEDGK